MTNRETRVRTRNGVLVVADDHVRLERGAVMQRTLTRIPRARITQVRLTSRFNTAPLTLGALLLAASLALTITADAFVKAIAVPQVMVHSMALVLVVSGGLSLLSLPITWRAVLEVSSAHDRILVQTRYRDRPRLEQAFTRLFDGSDHHGTDLVQMVNTPSGSHPESG